MEISLFQWLSLIFCVTMVVAQETTDQPDPCIDKKCKKPPGSMCVPVLKGDKLKPKCRCPTDCNDEPSDPVCSVYGKQYDNLCELHLGACQKKRTIRLAYKGACVANQDECIKDELMQFPHRLLEWFLHLKEIDEFGQLDASNNINKISDEERDRVSRWKFDQLDRNNDNQLDGRDLKEFRYALMPLEHCASKFFSMCDIDKNSKVSYEEWTDCLMVNDRPESGIVSSQTYMANAQVRVADPNAKTEKEPSPEDEDVDEDDDDDGLEVVQDDEEEDQPATV